MTELKQTESEINSLEKRGYKLIQYIGEGAYAKVYVAEFTSPISKTSVQLACKVINSEQAPQRFLTKFLPRELKILIKINHPHIIQVHSIFQRKQRFFIFMRHGENGDLLEHLLKHGVVKENQARIWARQISLALQYLHTLEIAHRDLKCENVLITKHNNVKLGDFGFARSVLSEYRRKESSETYCGSLSYVAPEILKGEPYYPKIADLWSLGVVIYTMINRSSPFKMKNIRVLYDNQMQKNWSFREKYAYNHSGEVRNLISGLLEPDVDKRYKIEQVISSAWLTKDPKLKAMNAFEYAALQAAIDEAKSLGIPLDSIEGFGNRKSSNMLRKSKIRNSLTVYKEFDVGFDLHMIRSDFNTADGRLSI